MSNRPTRLEIRELSRSFPGIQALDGVSLRIAAGEVHALVGENGAGKSTLIKLVAGVLAPDRGQIRLDDRPLPPGDPRAARRQGVVTVFQEAAFFPHLSIAENMALPGGLPLRAGFLVDWPAVECQARQLMAATGESWEVRADCHRLSVAQRQLLQIAAAVQHQARLLVLDEPTSALSDREARWLFAQVRRLQRDGAAILYVSHRQDEIFALADRISVLRDGRLVWTGATGDIDRAGLVRQMVGREYALQADRRPASCTEPGRADRLVVHRLDDRDARFRKVSLQVDGGQIVAFYGLIGAGRSEFVQAVCGLRPVAGGEVRVDGVACTIREPRDAVSAGLAYLPEDRLTDGICAGRSIRENLVLATLGRWTSGRWFSSKRREADAAATMIQRLDIRCRSAADPSGQLSGGNQQKVVLGRWLLADPAVLCLDEPTRGIDLAAKQEVHRRLRELADEGRAILMVSSDLEEVLACADRVYVMRAGELVGPFDPATTTPDQLAAAALPVEARVSDPSDTAQDHELARDASSDLESATSASDTNDGGHPRAEPADARGGRWSRRVRRLPQELGLAFVVLLLGGWLAATSHGFSGVAVVSAASVWILLGLAAATTIMAGGIDISLGSLLALSAACAAFVMKLDLPTALTLPLAIGTACAVGIVGGLCNAGLSLVGRLHPIVVTLGTMTIYRGLVLTLLGRKAMTGLPSALGALAYHPETHLRGTVLIVLAVAAAVALGFGHTRSGRHLIAWGSSPVAAELAGISRRRVWCLAFGVGGGLAGLAGVLQLAESGQMQAQLGTGWELTAIAVAVVGGVSITGGRGTVVGVVLGAILLRLVNSALVRWGIADDRTDLFVGLLLLLAVVVDLVWRRRKAAWARERS